MREPYIAEVAAGICRLFVQVPEDPGEHPDRDRRVRDADYYAGAYLHSWQEDQRVHSPEAFRALPWYRQRDVCRRVVSIVHGKVVDRLAGATSFTSQDVHEIWQDFRKELPEEAQRQYDEFRELLHNRGDFVP